MTQEEAKKSIRHRGIYRHQIGKLYSVVGFGSHSVNKVVNGEKEEKEVNVILTPPYEEGKDEVIVMPVLKFVEPLNDKPRFEEVS